MGLKMDPKAVAVAVGETRRGPACPSCGQFGMQNIEGCLTCPNCGYSKCG
jgi:ribonucleoside-diphosphate reductase alpha chain